MKQDLELVRRKVVRQDRMDVEDLDCQLEYQGRRYKVLNVSPFGTAFRSIPGVSTPDEMLSCTMLLNGVTLGEVHLRCVRKITPEGDGPVMIGAEVIGEPIPVGRIVGLRDAAELLEKQHAYFTKVNAVPEEFRRRVFEIKDWLEQLRGKIEEAAARSGEDDNVSRREYEEAFVEMVGTYLTQAMPAKNEQLCGILPTSNEETLKASIEFFRRKLYDLIYDAPFSNRVFHKPLGYAGDYEMMNIIYREKGLGETLFAKCLNHYWVSEPAAQAVRNRADYLIGRIGETFKAHKGSEPPTFLSVACGPAKEWQRMMSEVRAFNDKGATVHLLDQDERALKHAQRQMRTLGYQFPNKFQFDYVNMAIKNVIAKGLESEQYDLIYSAGLFDYFSDPVAQMAAMRLFAAVKPGGRLVIGNFNVTNPNSMMMNLALDWHLIYRSEEDLKRLFAPLGGRMRVDKESLDINLFCVIEKV